MQMLCKSFLMSEEFEGPHGHCLLEKGLLHVCICIKPFFSVHNLKMHIKAHAGTGLNKPTVLKIHKAFPQWREAKKPNNVFILESGNNIKTH